MEWGGVVLKKKGGGEGKKWGFLSYELVFFIFVGEW